MDVLGFKVREEVLQRVLLVEAHIGVAVAILNAHYEVADDGNARTIAGELLVGHLGIVLLRLDELVVEVKVIGVARHKLAGAHEYLHEKTIQFRCGIEIVAAPRLGGVGRVRGAQFLDATKDGVRRTCVQGGMKREMGHQVAGHVFDTVTATEIHAHQRACYFAVLVAESGAPKPQLAVDNWADVTVKFLHHVKNSTERGDFLRFYAYICHAIDDFCLS